MGVPSGVPIQATLTVDSDELLVDVSNASSVGMDITGTWTGTVSFETSTDGTTWSDCYAFPVPVTSTPGETSTTANGSWVAAVGGVMLFRVTFSTPTSGSVVVTLAPSVANLTTSQSVTVGAVTLGAGSAAIGTVKVMPSATGGLSAYSVVWPNNATGDTIKTSAGQVMGLHLGNSDTIGYYARLYNLATAPAASDSASIKERFYIPAGDTCNFVVNPGAQYGTGIGIRLSGGIADSDTVSVAGSKVLVTVRYQ